MAFVEVARVDEIPAGAMKAATVGGKEIIVVNCGGQFYALGRRCTHMGGDLARGKLQDNTVICPRHGSTFDVTSGKALSGPKFGPLKLGTKDQVTYEVKIEGMGVMVNIP
jgi:3-phenylpropionate/trans-cinnamate dioxygenase ferredoxin subunit